MAPTHGIPGTYAGRMVKGVRMQGCRCDDCRRAWREYRRPRTQAYRARKRAERIAEGLRDS